ncbi:Prepilin peptidase [Deinococcus proteolyticus MRP]|uniref:Prepilin peptidase n=1 Tax=Deinococcus proteolyticus (strain ATCC 35074 / DSM 20540 / JCM 6276 / NBRC 101906 / NCIMB 13154 / VKM Ac-1939 / CCM 2703 / MRP) TaxID=693977 RepID=F0RMR6_DEIPM|nr:MULTISPECIES: A24 family peptidase [Deinococcus]ADY27134.1 Prepilin peptidase [Deinococcus proteolyticus MRP]MCY1703259.1 prepilin peptidase [Deinococcus sp. SL84]
MDLLPLPFVLITALVFGLLVGSFTNVLIWRLPRGESISFPPSHCPHCDHPLAPKDLVPVFSWLSLGGKCRYCGAPIKTRYPTVELITGVAYALIAYFYPPALYGFGTLGLMLFFTILLAGSAIDLDTYTIPDELTLPGVALGLGFAALAGAGLTAGGLPNFSDALNGALMGAGILMTIDLLGSWVLRRFRERQYPDLPIGHQQIALALLVGAWAGPLWGLGAALLSAAVNAGARRVIPIPELLTLGGALLSVALGVNLGRDPLAMLNGALQGAGAAALVAGLYWWIQYAFIQKKSGETEVEEDAPFDPSAMGFGDVKLAGAIGAFLGLSGVLVSLGVAIFAGAILGVIQMAMKAENRLKFGPYLAIGAVVAMLWGDDVVSWYRGMLGL